MYLVVATVAVACVGCAPHKDTDLDLDILLANYHEQNKQIKARRQINLERGIERLEVVLEGSSPEQVLVSVDLKEARLEVLVQLILKRSRTEFIREIPRLVGTVTALFERRPLVEALSILLRPSGMTASLKDSMVVINEAPVQTGPATLSSADDSGNVSHEFSLSHLRTEHAVKLLNSLYPYNDQEGTREIMVAPLPKTNSIVISGRPAIIDKVVHMLNHIDIDSGHVLLEALIVEFNVQSFLDLGSRLEGGSTGEFRNIFIDFANLIGDTVSFTRVADTAHTATFTAVLNMLVQDEDARIISRPYLATTSGTSAHLEITEDRFVVVQAPGGIDVTLEKISSGIILEVLPVITKDGRIALDLEIDQSQFIPTLENVEQRRSRNSVTTSTTVEDGQTVIIGGLMLKLGSDSVAGLPGLRDLPVLKYFFGHQDMFRQQSQVIIFVTPHLWSPGMVTPTMDQKNWSLYNMPSEEEPK